MDILHDYSTSQSGVITVMKTITKETHATLALTLQTNGYSSRPVDALLYGRLLQEKVKGKEDAHI